jgi:hypothetical protein
MEKKGDGESPLMAVNSGPKCGGLGRLWSPTHIRSRAHNPKLSSLGPVIIVSVAFNDNAEVNNTCYSWIQNVLLPQTQVRMIRISP